MTNSKRGRPAKSPENLKKPFNRMLAPRAIQAIKAIALIQGCSEAEAMEKAAVAYEVAVRAQRR